MTIELLLMFDGGAYKNPGHAGCSWVIFNLTDINQKIKNNFNDLSLIDIKDIKSLNEYKCKMMLTDNIDIFNPIITGYKYLGPNITNNIAEYSGLLNGLLEIQKNFIEPISLKIQGDSLLVINQITNKWKIKNKKLLTLHLQIQELLKTFYKYDCSHVLREFNKIADKLSKKAYSSEI